MGQQEGGQGLLNELAGGKQGESFVAGDVVEGAGTNVGAI